MHAIEICDYYINHSTDATADMQNGPIVCDTHYPAVTVWQNMWLTGVQSMLRITGTSKIWSFILWSVIYLFL